MIKPIIGTPRASRGGKYLLSTIEIAMIIVERLLFLATTHGERPVPIRLYQPVRGARDWSCAYEIGWPGEARRGFGYGIDAGQSLLLALQAIGTDLYTSDHHRSGKLRWDAPGRGYGFPVPGTIRDLLIGNDALAF